MRLCPICSDSLRRVRVDGQTRWHCEKCRCDYLLNELIEEVA